MANELAARSDAVADRLEAGDGCGARAEAESLQAAAIAAVNRGRVPSPYQEELISSIGALVASVECVPPPATEDDEDDEDDEDGDKGKGRGKGKGKGKKGGGGEGDD